jgi:catechol 2,3-dioxygenase-like lactoylglutathione lyase family enzyme/GNAT superfamily N-acetyltransferase
VSDRPRRRARLAAEGEGRSAHAGDPAVGVARVVDVAGAGADRREIEERGATMMTRSTAVLACADVQQTVDFYCNTLGFKLHWLWEDPPTFGAIGMGHVEVFLQRRPDLAGKTEGHAHCFHVTDADGLHAQHAAAGAPILAPPANKPWGMREYTVRDPNGYHLRFLGPQKYQRPPAATNTLPPHIRLDIRVPTIEEYIDLCASVGWARHRPSMQDALDHTLVGVIATDTRAVETVGMVRATGDGRYYMIWDVIVKPAYQGQRIGSTIIEAALAEMRRRGAPQGAFVGLFTGKPDFYERLGFKKDVGMHLAL